MKILAFWITGVIILMLLPGCQVTTVLIGGDEDTEELVDAVTPPTSAAAATMGRARAKPKPTAITTSDPVVIHYAK